MMARNHVATASALWFTAGVGAPALVGSSLTPAQMVSGGVVMAFLPAYATGIAGGAIVLLALWFARRSHHL